MKPLDPILPGNDTWLGVLGGGQLGRMFVHAAQAMGYQVQILEEEDDCPASQVAQKHLRADYTDLDALSNMALQCQAITTEFENVPASSLEYLAQTRTVSPNASAVAIAQDRLQEKKLFTHCATQCGVMPAPHLAIADADAASQDLPAELFPAILKTQRLGYDGKGQIRVSSAAELPAALAQLNGVPCVLEKMLPLAHEISVLVVRGQNGEAKVYAPAENVHRHGILHTSSAPAPHVNRNNLMRAQTCALTIIEELAYVGVLCVEFFVLEDGSLVVNEIAPRPHNSAHYTIDACVTSQFAQQVRALVGLPLGDVRQHSFAMMLNLLGDIWLDASGTQREPNWGQVLAIPGANLHLYGKQVAKAGRKMGHITFTAESAEEAQAKLTQACLMLGITP